MLTSIQDQSKSQIPPLQGEEGARGGEGKRLYLLGAFLTNDV